jgi:hypothetical protein
VVDVELDTEEADVEVTREGRLGDEGEDGSTKRDLRGDDVVEVVEEESKEGEEGVKERV